MRRGPRAPTRERLITAIVVAGAVLFVLWQLQPSLLFSSTTPTGGDTGGYVWGPQYMRDHLLPHGRITGWTMDWHAGLAAFVFYFPLPSFVIAVASLVLPYEVTFKLVSVLGLLALPLAAWAFGRLTNLRFPIPALMSAASVVFLFDHFAPRARGGDVISTVRGEFAFSFGLALALLFLGLIARGLETGRHRASAAAVLGLTVLSHVFAVVFSLAGAALLLVARRSRARLLHVAAAVGAGLLLAAFWLLPLQWRYAYVPPTRIAQVGHYVTNVFPFVNSCADSAHCGRGRFPFSQVWHLFPVTVLAVTGIVLAARRRERVLLAMGALGALMALAFVLKPAARLQNDRFLPFWFLCLYLLAAYGVGELGHLAQDLVVRRRRRYAPTRGTEPTLLHAVPLVAFVLVMWLVGIPVASAPGGLPLHVTDKADVRGFVTSVYGGYEHQAGAQEYRALMRTLDDVGRTHGCGRVMGEADLHPLISYGSFNALLLAPYFTDGCITTVNEGLEVSATSPYEQLLKKELSQLPFLSLQNLPYGRLDVARGVDHLRLLGARYYAAYTADARRQADADHRLERRADAGAWRVYQVAGTAVVTPLRYRPAVVTGIGKPGRSWTAVGVDFFQRDPSAWEVPLVASGPRDWPRVAARQQPAKRTKDGLVVLGSTVDVEPPRQPVTPARVSNVRLDDDRVSFDVDRPGTPVLVRVSYFPNWRATGARGPWRATPNFMVVVPTSRHVSLRYGWTPVDAAGTTLSLFGAGAVVALAWADRAVVGPGGSDSEPAPAPAAAPPTAPAAPSRPSAQSARKRGRSRSRGRRR